MEDLEKLSILSLWPMVNKKKSEELSILSLSPEMTKRKLERLSILSDDRQNSVQSLWPNQFCIIILKTRQDGLSF